MTTATTIDLTELLTDEQYESVFGISSIYEQDLIEAVRRAQDDDGEVYVGVKDTYFPDPVFLTTHEVFAHAEFMHGEQARYEPIPLDELDEVESQVWDAVMQVDPGIVRIIKNAL